jgi:hypothetical protein
MNRLASREIQAVKKIKEMARRRMFAAKRPFVTSKSEKVRCGIKGCLEEAITLKGKVPVCSRHK